MNTAQVQGIFMLYNCTTQHEILHGAWAAPSWVPFECSFLDFLSGVHIPPGAERFCPAVAAGRIPSIQKDTCTYILCCYYIAVANKAWSCIESLTLTHTNIYTLGKHSTSAKLLRATCWSLCSISLDLANCCSRGDIIIGANSRVH